MESKKDKNVNHAVQYDHFGHLDVYYIAELPMPSPKEGEVLVKVKAAGINPGETSIREGFLQQMFPSTFPSGQGTDFAGIIEAKGDGVSDFKVSDEVIGYSHERSSHAEYLVVPAERLVLRPENVSWEQAGGLFVAGTTAYAAVKAVDPKPGETVIVSGAAGGVGTLAVQIAKKTGATVLGIASEENHKWLKKHGIIPVAYGDAEETEENIQAALGDKTAHAFVDTSGKGYVDMAIKMGIPADRINTIIDFAAAGKYKAKAEGSSFATSARILGELAGMISDGSLEMPIAKKYKLTEVKEAFEELEKRHTHGKIVLIP